MRKFLLTICTMTIGIIVGVAYAETFTMTWLNEDRTTTYDTTTCTAGNDIILPTAPTKRGYTFMGWDVFTPIEYLESTGTQYIDTGVQNTSKVETGINITSINSNYTLLYGSQKSTNPVTRRNVSVSASSSILHISVGSNDNTSIAETSAAITTGVFHDLTLVFGTIVSITMDGVTTTATSTGDNASTGLNDFLFAYNYGGSPRHNVKAKISYAKIYGANGSLVRDFVPAKNSSNVVGMYDLVSGQFFTNQGTGNFIAGPVISE